jgi:GTP:adenosylcobinamide-phosphate guanylyltransferase
MSTLIVPAGGKSTRFNCIQKWALPIGDSTMLEEAVSCIKARRKYIGVLAENLHDIPDLLPGDNISIIPFIFPTSNQVEMVRLILEQTGIQHDFMIKDCDNKFTTEFVYGNFVGYTDLKNTVFNPDAKSYVQLNEYNEIVNIVEKKIISDKFCCGLYGFESVSEFMYYSDGCSYVSEVIFKMLLDKKIFTGVHCSDYIDWGTREAYDYYNSKERKE